MTQNQDKMQKEECKHKFIGKGMNEQDEYFCECLFCGKQIDARKL